MGLPPASILKSERRLASLNMPSLILERVQRSCLTMFGRQWRLLQHCGPLNNVGYLYVVSKLEEPVPKRTATTHTTLKESKLLENMKVVTRVLAHSTVVQRDHLLVVLVENAHSRGVKADGDKGLDKALGKVPDKVLGDVREVAAILERGLTTDRTPVDVLGPRLLATHLAVVAHAVRRDLLEELVSRRGHLEVHAGVNLGLVHDHLEARGDRAKGEMTGQIVDVAEAADEITKVGLLSLLKQPQRLP